MVEDIITFFKKPKEDTVGKAPEGYCPNCWGKQVYGDQIREIYEDKQIDVNNHTANYSFIQKFVIGEINGIHLKKGNNSLECPTCHTIYQK